MKKSNVIPFPVKTPGQPSDPRQTPDYAAYRACRMFGASGSAFDGICRLSERFPDDVALLEETVAFGLEYGVPVSERFLELAKRLVTLRGAWVDHAYVAFVYAVLGRTGTARLHFDYAEQLERSQRRLQLWEAGNEVQPAPLFNRIRARVEELERTHVEGPDDGIHAYMEFMSVMRDPFELQKSGQRKPGRPQKSRPPAPSSAKGVGTGTATGTKKPRTSRNKKDASPTSVRK